MSTNLRFFWANRDCFLFCDKKHQRYEYVWNFMCHKGVVRAFQKELVYTKTLTAPAVQCSTTRRPPRRRLHRGPSSAPARRGAAQHAPRSWCPPAGTGATAGGRMPARRPAGYPSFLNGNIYKLAFLSRILSHGNNIGIKGSLCVIPNYNLSLCQISLKYVQNFLSQFVTNIHTSSQTFTFII